MADTGIADRLRAEGLTVREVPGWKTRGRDFAGVASAFNPKGSVNHHTAGPPDAPGRRTPSLGIVVQGRSDLPGPLCHVYLGYDDVVYVVAAGVANHAGLPDAGTLRGMTGNSTAYGLEIEHPGTFPLPKARAQIAAKIHAALLRGRGLPASQVVQHWEWAPSRKIDLATNMHGGSSPAPTAIGFRALVAVELEPPARWQVRLVDNKGSTVDKSLVVGTAGLARRVAAFTTRVAPRIARMAVAKRGPRIRLIRVQ